ncbi:MAG TPA: hypothetical protein VFN10_09380 [Thermoanaerobaculia bacterium]|nr:hypothetical protein [Thermoanaerobaculia bacterium]
MTARAYRAWLVALLFVSAAARLVLQMAPMPPYAGLDEIYHVARVRFVAQEHRQPSKREPSISRGLARSIRQEAGAPPAFAIIAERWPDVVASGARFHGEAPVDGDYQLANYEAQQPSLYYALAAHVTTSLRGLRLLSLVFALVVIACSAFIGWRLFGEVGLLAAALLAHLPTWQTLVSRASNDALACALIALALAFTASRRTAGEAIAWALAIATKLYALPVLIAVPFFWRQQRATRARMAIVAIACALALSFVIVDATHRTGNALGIEAFDPPHAAAQSHIDWRATARIFLPTFVQTLFWTSGQHWNALTPLGLAVLVLPLLVLLARRIPAPLLAALIAFALAQLVDFAGFVRAARAAGLSVPAGGPGAWYWYALAPLLVLLIAPALRTKRAIVLVAWLLAFDIATHEGALLRDWRGVTTPAHRGPLVRWGSNGNAGASLAVGPFADQTLWLRAIDVAALIALLALSRRLSPTAAPNVPDRDRAPAAEPVSPAA